MGRGQSAKSCDGFKQKASGKGCGNSVGQVGMGIMGGIKCSLSLVVWTFSMVD